MFGGAYVHQYTCLSSGSTVANPLEKPEIERPLAIVTLTSVPIATNHKGFQLSEWFDILYSQDNRLK